MTETPPEGRTWVTIEVYDPALEDVDNAGGQYLGRKVVALVHGPKPESDLDKSIRLFAASAEHWEKAANEFSVAGIPGRSWVEAGTATRYQEAALKALSKYLKGCAR